jgi:hypothetical protein
MRISRHELDQLIEAEINEIFGFGKEEASKEYPASEMATIIRGLDDASKMSGAELTPSQREAIVDELTGVLEDEGFVIKENERLFTGEEDVVVTHQNAPKLKVFLDTVAQKSPKVFKQLLGLFNRSALDISPVVKNIIPSITTVADLEPDEDQTATIVAEPVDAPDDEDQTATIVAEPVVAPDDEDLDIGDIAGSDQEVAASADAIASTDDEDQTATIVTEPVGAPDDEDQTATIAAEPVLDPEDQEHYSNTFDPQDDDDFNEFFLSLDDEDLKEFYDSVPREDFKWGTFRAEAETLHHIYSIVGQARGWSHERMREARRILDADQEAFLTHAELVKGLDAPEIVQIIKNAQQKLIDHAKSIAAKRAPLKEHKQLKRMKVLAGVK